MPNFNFRSDSVDVEEVLERIRARLREKRDVDYTEQEIRELAAVKLEKFLDPRAVRSSLLQQFRAGKHFVPFGPDPLFGARRPIVARVRRLLRPVLRLFFNPDPIAQALGQLNEMAATADLYFELLHNLVVELTRIGIRVRNLEMRVDSLTGRLEFDERRARALESVVVYRASRSEEESSGSRAEAVQPGEGPGERSRRLRRRRGRRGGEPAARVMERAAPGPRSQGPEAQDERHAPTERVDASVPDTNGSDRERES